MSNKIFLGIIAVLSAGVIGYVALNKETRPPTPRLGQNQPDKGTTHVPTGEAKYETDLPTSGPHNQQPAPWGSYKQEIPNENLVHSMEHGGVIVTYKPGLDQATVEKIDRLFVKPFSNRKFTPSKAIVMPYAKNDAPIVMRSWNRIFRLQQFDERAMVDYYLKNVNKSPEPAAQ